MDYAFTASLKGRVAVVTGGSGGIGLESSKALQENGATVVICDINVV
jgi:NAD(P)-dependent dehydrogenase (short-subunit alcohol dehydrogenase family)